MHEQADEPTLPNPAFTFVQEAEASTAPAMSQSRAVKAAQAAAIMKGKVQWMRRESTVQIETKRANPTLPFLKRAALIQSPVRPSSVRLKMPGYHYQAL